MRSSAKASRFSASQGMDLSSHMKSLFQWAPVAPLRFPFDHKQTVHDPNDLCLINERFIWLKDESHQYSPLSVISSETEYCT
jgi:hypothetical protein